MPATPWLSVLVPVYNVEPYLQQCVDSVMSQADQGVELLLLDDVSTDRSAARMHALRSSWGDRVQLHAHDRNRGLSAARNTLLAQARGAHVWFLDSDDWIAADVLPALKALLQGAASPDLVFFDYAVRRGRDRLKYRLRGEHHRPGFAGPSGRVVRGSAQILQAVLATGNLFAWAHVSRRSLWADGLQFPEGRSFEDMATTPRLVLRAASAWHVRQPWVMYRRRDDSISARMSARKVADLSAGLAGVRDEWLQRMPDAPASLRFALAHQAARNLLAAQRHAARLPADEARALWPQLHEDFLGAVGDDLAPLLAGYLWRGWWWRRLRLVKALSRRAP